ncbi:MAG: ABC transporter permease [Flavobacterium sp. BFFFF1]|uniref:ABC transporter permease n=1 Tax=Flavobacterium sp. BFFFF1 TaxID=2015557 RepID=UPI000BDB6483|nr:ABC transporter permease subunit [Flavobacterium sp. BFFFF1]OYU81865.1 MAG: ABC transporter permease [Flavobacterium sp. BFFFF1]
MKRLLSIELQKIWRNRSSRILTITYFALLGTVALLASVNFNFIGINARLADLGIFNFPYIWHFNLFIASYFKFFMAIIIVSMIANEYSYGTLKQNLIDGLSKKEFVASKFLTILLFAAISTIFMFIITLILGYSFSSYNELSIVFTDLDYLFAYFIRITAFFSMCLFFGFLIKRSAFAIGFILVWYIIEKILMQGFRIPGFLSDLLPLESMYNLTKEPFTRLSAIKNLETVSNNGHEVVRDYGIHLSSIMIAIVWIVIFLLMSYKLLKKRDL